MEPLPEVKSSAPGGRVHVFLEAHSNFPFPICGVVGICPFLQGFQDLLWLGGDRPAWQPALVPLAVTPASSKAVCLALPRADKM